MKKLLPILQPALVALLAALAFASVVPRGGFVFDDHVLIERNEDIRRGDIWWQAFRRDYYATSALAGTSGYYRPVAVLANAADMRLWRYRRWGFHVTNLVLHAAASVALAPALGALGAPGAAAWAAALLFAVHPVHAESVAFVSGRVDVLAALASFLALSFAASRRRWAWLAVGMAALLAFLSKEAAVALPLLLVLVWIARASAQRAANATPPDRWMRKQALAVAAAALAALALRYQALHAWLPATAQGAPLSPPPLLLLQTLSFVLASVYAPARLLSLEPSPGHLHAARLAAGVVVGVAIWVAAWRADAPSRPLLRRSLWAAFLTLLPVSNLLPQETQLSERFLYLASAFLLLPAGVLAAAAWRRGGAWQPATAGAGGIALLLLLGISAWRAQAWRNDLQLWQHAVREEPGRAAFWDRLGLSLTERRRLDEAEPMLRRALEIDPRYFNAHFNLGTLLQATQRDAEAAAAFRQAVALQPRHVDAHLSLGITLVALGDMQGAYAEFQTGAAIHPEHADAARLAGSAALQLGRLPEARRWLERAQHLRPQHEGVRTLLEQLRLAEQRAAPRP